MDLELKGKTALVTGSSSGIGFAIAESLFNEGCSVILNGRDSGKLALAQKQLNGSLVLNEDLLSKKGVANTISFLKDSKVKLDILVCNIGSGQSVPPGQETREEFSRVFDVNFFGTTSLVEALFPFLQEREGNIVAVSSICGHESLGAPITYSSAKAALNSFIKGYSKFAARFNVRVNAVSPGNILFKDSTWDFKIKANKVAVMNMIEENVPLNRFGNPREVGDLVTFIASERASFMTGEIVVLDGGQLRS